MSPHHAPCSAASSQQPASARRLEWLNWIQATSQLLKSVLLDFLQRISCRLYLSARRPVAEPPLSTEAVVLTPPDRPNRVPAPPPNTEQHYSRPRGKAILQ